VTGCKGIDRQPSTCSCSYTEQCPNPPAAPVRERKPLILERAVKQERPREPLSSTRRRTWSIDGIIVRVRTRAALHGSMHLPTFRKRQSLSYTRVLLCRNTKCPRFTDERHCVLTASTLSTSTSSTSIQSIAASRTQQCTSLVIVLSILDVTHA